MKILKIDHIGIAVNNLKKSLEFYTKILGLEADGIEVFEEQKVRVGFLSCGDSRFELMESITTDGAIAKYIEKNGEGIQHISLRVDNIESALTELKEKEIRLINDTPQCFEGGAKIAFINPKATTGVLIELCERA
ncbi:MAG: methylmalonyl-CoA epimerase [Firmicutes bacterium HGW-Firmicutes-12]|jgi:methylmalonyl-CoA/ethylmalonyl-CoA epimerase|nr:MAG: methylmalonyl-CoA epimerase [Firmicutes bacterium HGW-Firmicutes-12]